jgi:hypothetical protein
MDSDIASLRQIEAVCIAKLSRNARVLREADPSLNAGIARARACQQPKITGEYLWVVQRLQHAGLQPKIWK